MRITFDLRRVGLGDNGGSSTIINSANTLADLGNEVFVIDSGKNQHTWTPLKVKHIIINKIEKIPDADFIIATGYKSVGPTVNAPSRCGIKLHWMRGWETWQMSEKNIIEQILRAPTIKVVNGIGLHGKLEQHRCQSHIIRPGYDIDNFKPLGIRQKNKKIILGGLYNEGRGKQLKRTSWIYEAAFRIKRIMGVEFWLFGTHPQPKGFLIDRYIQKPSLKEKNDFYNHINIWLAPTALEGLHMPPAEAMLTGCPVIATNTEMNGMWDYLSDMKTGLVCEDKQDSFIKAIEKLINMKDLQIELGNNAREKILKLGSRKENMTKFVDLMRRLKDENTQR